MRTQMKSLSSQNRPLGHQTRSQPAVYGNGNRFKQPWTSELESPSEQSAKSITIADLNKDGYLDLIFPLYASAFSEIRWGNANGYSAKNVTRLEANGTPHAFVADLDGDGWLDVGFTSRFMQNGRTVNSETYVDWSDPQGVLTRTALQGFTTLDATVADFMRRGRSPR
jgi:hypothetical protein